MFRAVVPRLRDVFFISIAAACMLLGPRMLNIDSDLGRHLTLGNYMLESGTIPVQDILSSSRYGASRPPYEWLSEIVFAIANRWLGLGGVVLMTGLVIASAFAIALADAMDRSHSPVLSVLVTALAAAASSLHWLTRPHIFSFALFALWTLALERLRQGRRMPIWVFAGLMLLWANVQGGFVFGFLAWAAYTAGWLVERRNGSSPRATGKNLLWAGVASIVASVVTPASWHNWQAVLQNRSLYVLSRTSETMPPNLAAPAFWPFVALVALALFGLALRLRTLAIAHAFLLGSLASAGLAMARNIPFFAIAAAPILSVWIGEGLRARLRWAGLERAVWSIDGGKSVFIWPLLFAAATIGWVAAGPSAVPQIGYRFDPHVFPVAAADWLEAHPPQGNMFNDFNWGGYLLYRLWPREHVFIDSQTDFYGEGFTRQYEHVMVATAGWQQVLDRYQVDWLIVPVGAGVAQAAEGSPYWSIEYKDNVAVILVRR